MKPAELTKLLNAKFKREYPKSNDFYGQGKVVYKKRLIQGVTHSPMDCTSAKSDKIRAIKSDIGYELKRHGAVEIYHDVFEMKYMSRNTEKTYTIHIHSERFIPDHDYPSYVAEWIDWFIAK